MSGESTLFGFKRDEVIFHQGESSDRVAFIVRGAVEITRMVDDKPHVAGTVEAGEFVDRSAPSSAGNGQRPFAQSVTIRPWSF